MGHLIWGQYFWLKNLFLSGKIWQWFQWCKTKWAKAGVHWRALLYYNLQKIEAPSLINPFWIEEIPWIRLDTNLPSINDDPSDELGEVDEILNGDNEGIVRYLSFWNLGLYKVNAGAKVADSDTGGGILELYYRWSCS